MKDLVLAVRKPEAVSRQYDVVTTRIDLGGDVVQHRAVANVRKIGGSPAMVVVSTIIPDRPPKWPLASSPFILLAIEDLDSRFMNQLGTHFGFSDLKWIDGSPAARDCPIGSP